MSNKKNDTKRLITKRLLTAFEWKTFFVWRVTYICVHVTQAQILPTSSKHVSVGMQFLRLGIGGLSHQSCMSLHIGTNNIVGGSINWFNKPSACRWFVTPWRSFAVYAIEIRFIAGKEPPYVVSVADIVLGPFLLTWFNFNTSMDK